MNSIEKNQGNVKPNVSYFNQALIRKMLLEIMKEMSSYDGVIKVSALNNFLEELQVLSTSTYDKQK